MTSVNLVDVNGKSRKVNLGRELASGGAGTVYLIDGEPSTAVKIYHPQTLIDEGKIYADKIKCMLRSVPSLASSTTGVVQIAWPLAIAHDLAGNFVGFSMPTLDFQSTEGMASLLQPKLASLKFKKSDLRIRATVAANLAGVVSAIHDKGHQLVDLKPENLRLYRDGLYVAVLDCDGFQIQIPGQTLSAPQVTVEYLAPEFQSKPVTKPEHQDRFALAVIIFRLLNFGIHPYQGISKDQNAPTDMEGKISQGMYAYAKTPHRMIDPLPQSAHIYFPEELRKLFDRAFGSFVDKRPTAHEWADVLKKFAQQRNPLIKQCSHGHFWFTGQPCGECHRNGAINPGGVIPSSTPRHGTLPTPTPTLSGQMNGRFTYTWPNGNQYDGYWINGIRTGRGTFTWANGDRYSGEFLDGKMNGRGTYIWSNGDRYEGNWVNDNRTGHGIYNYANGAREEGEWLNNQLVNSNAILQPQVVVTAQQTPKIQKAPSAQTATPTQTIATQNTSSSPVFKLIGFIAVFVAIAYGSHFLSYGVLALISVGIGLIGMGIKSQTFADAFVLSTLILALSSAGKYSWHWVFSDESSQSSIPVTQEDEDNLKKLGEEQLRKGAEVIRQQELKNKESDIAKQISNQGAEKTTVAQDNNSKPITGSNAESNGNRYEGDIKDGKKNGRGTFTWANGDRYEGDWINDNRTGHGIYTWPNGNRYEGEFANGKMNGYGTLTLPSGARYEGNWINDKLINNNVLPQNIERKKSDSINDL